MAGENGAGGRGMRWEVDFGRRVTLRSLAQRGQNSRVKNSLKKFKSNFKGNFKNNFNSNFNCGGQECPPHMGSEQNAGWDRIWT